MFSSLIFVGVLLSTTATAQQYKPLTVSTSAGVIEGAQCTGSQASSFLAIPFAEPPVGDLRLASPKPYDASYAGELLRANTKAPSCIQFGSEFVEKGTQSEDCLYLDVWVPPGVTKDSKLPVKVWIFGGSDEAGDISNPLYDGCTLAIAQTLVVSINYRLGPLGFLALESAGLATNFGIQDILLGLQWVQENIQAFGGDPRRVLLFGQSAGAVNTFTIATLPQAPTLMNAAIMESGGGRDVPLKSHANKLGGSYTERLNCSMIDITCLRSKSPSELKAAVVPSSGIGISGIIQQGWNPVVDGKVIHVQPSESGVKVSSIFESNSKDATLFLLTSFPPPTMVTLSNYTSFLQDNFGPAASVVAQKYPLSASNFSSDAAFQAIETMKTDYDYKCPAYRGLKGAINNNVPAFTIKAFPRCTIRIPETNSVSKEMRMF